MPDRNRALALVPAIVRAAEQGTAGSAQSHTRERKRWRASLPHRSANS
jgi:hypothetical protein